MNDRIMLAAPKSGSGKTVLACALIKTLIDRGIKTAAFKCGPDYIDPMFHKNVLGVPSANLDTFFTDEKCTLGLFLKDAEGAEISVIEGVMGLFDGLGGVREEGSSYHLAEVTKTPVILVVDAKGSARSVLPLLAGFMAYDRSKLIGGVILNRINNGLYQTLKPLIEDELGIKALGFVPENSVFSLESRHLGLVTPDETENIKKRISRMAVEMERTVSIEGILEIASQAEELACVPKCAVKKPSDGPVIAVARDRAFCFYYEENIRLLEEYGARIAYFSPLNDDILPEKCSGILLGGGYPEVYAARLSQNRRTISSIKKAAEKGMPIVAECGGFMYLHSAIEDKDGNIFPMAGILPGRCVYTGRLVRFGYISVGEKTSRFLPPGERIKGHEFHYYDSENNGDDCLAEKPSTGRTYSCVIDDGKRWLGFPHLYYPSNPSFAESFVRMAKGYAEISYGKNEISAD